MDDRESLIKHLKYCCKYDADCMKCERWDYDCGGSRCVENLLEKAAVALEQQRWIPVTERLPEKDGKFLVYKNVCKGYSTIMVVGFARNGRKVHEYDLRNHKKVWYDYDGEVGYYPLSSVTHWMPLPELPKEGADNVE